MKKVIVGAAIAAGVTVAAGPTLADGMPSQRYAEARGCASFAGFYAGGNVGWVHYNSNLEDQNNFVSFPFSIGGTTTYTGTDNAFGGGVQGGYNFQKHCTVFGLEADWSWTDAKVDSQAHPNFLGAPSSVGTAEGNLKSFGTLRTRAGVVVDSTLLYVTGGVAWLDARHSVSNAFPGLPTESFDVSSGTRWGWVGGLGAEYALSNSISIKSETLYMTTADDSHSVLANSVINRCTTNGAICDFKTSDSAWVARLGVNFRFGN